jgi:non-specific serine/threonine protein kinase
VALTDYARHLRADTKRGRNLLTAREQMVARLVALGRTNRQIAEELVIAEGTAERHVGNILSKLDMNGRSQVAAWAVAQGGNEDDPLYTPECLVRCTLDATGTRYGTFDFVIHQVTEHHNVTPESLAARV